MAGVAGLADEVFGLVGWEGGLLATAPTGLLAMARVVPELEGASFLPPIKQCYKLRIDEREVDLPLVRCCENVSSSCSRLAA